MKTRYLGFILLLIGTLMAAGCNRSDDSVFAVPQSPAATRTIAGTVVGSTAPAGVVNLAQLPLTGPTAVIMVDENGNQAASQVVTPADGRFSLTVPEGHDYVMVFREGSVDGKTLAVLTPDASGRPDFSLPAGSGDVDFGDIEIDPKKGRARCLSAISIANPEQDPADSDGDGIPDVCDRSDDEDEDGMVDHQDHFPFDAAESVDLDKDGIGDNADPDDDNNGVADAVELGKAIFFDANLSEPARQSCGSCHDPAAGFADPDSELPVSRGAIPSRVGNRNAQTISYAMFSPPLHFDPTMRPGIMEGMYVGGLFWDGRADTLEIQAKQPFFNVLEMHNPDKRTVVLSVRGARYAEFFGQVFGPQVLANPLSQEGEDHAFECVAQALAAYMRSPEVSLFTSKYDYWKAGKTELAEGELGGHQLFTGKALCFRCHAEPLFTNFGHQNLGTPRNPDNPFYNLPPELNPDGVNYIDRGLGEVLRARGVEEGLAAKEDGKFKIPSLRNCAVTPPYVHNGVHGTLRDVVMFNNTRDEPSAVWPPPEVPANVHRHMPPMAGTFGRLGLTAPEIDDLVAFLQTLTDGYFTPTAENRHPAAAAGPDQSSVTGATVQLDGGGSSDPDGDAITYRWNFVTVPMKLQMQGGQMMPMVSRVSFSDAGAKAPTFVPDIPGIYDIALTVTDGKLSSVNLMQVTVAVAP